MIDVKQFREQGYLYESIENYSDLINIEDYKSAKTEIDNDKKPSSKNNI